MLRLIVQKARSHFNTALEYADRDRNEEAIAELNNALELDRSHVNSHVVLGTLHAKLGQMEKAEESWREALTLDSRFQKAHEYLLKSDAGRRSLPIVRRQRFYMIAMIVVMCVLATWLVVLQWRGTTRPRYAQLELAWGFYRQSNDSEALEVIRRIPRKDKTNPIAGQATLLMEMIHARENLLLAGGQKYFDQMDLKKANDQIAELLNLNPPQETEGKALELRNRILEACQGIVTTGLESMQQGKATAETVQKTIDLYKEILGAGKPDDFLKTSEQALGIFNRQQKIGDVIQRFKQKKIDEMTLLKELTTLRDQYPDYPKLQNIIDAFYNPLNKNITASIETNLKKGNIDDAGESIEVLRRLMMVVHPDQASARITAYTKRLDTARTSAMLNDIRNSFTAGDFEQTVELGQTLLSKPIDETSRAMVQSILAEANVKLADQRWLWMRGLDRQYIDDQISIIDAEKTIRYFPQLEKYLSRKAYPNVADDMLFYLGMSYRKIGQKDKSKAAFDLLLSKQPKSNFVRWVKHYEEIDNPPKPQVNKPAPPKKTQEVTPAKPQKGPEAKPVLPKKAQEAKPTAAPKKAQVAKPAEPQKTQVAKPTATPKKAKGK